MAQRLVSCRLLSTTTPSQVLSAQLGGMDPRELPSLMQGLVVGPLGFEPRTDGLKVSGSSFKTAGKTQVSGHFPAKTVHMC